MEVKENMGQKLVMRTFEQICLDKLREIGMSSARDWAFAMGYKNPNALSKVIKRIIKTMPEDIIVYDNRKPRLYQVAD
jgi:hypothetical protein